MGKRRRGTAKTGDKKLYQSRDSEQLTTKTNKDDDDPMYDRVDRFHNDKDKEFLRFSDSKNAALDSDDDDGQEEAVMDLGLRGDSSSSDAEVSSDNDDESDEEDGKRTTLAVAEEAPTSDDDDEDDFELGNVRDWGKSKSAYYSGDTADLEIGQDEEDAYLEEEAAKEVEAIRRQAMCDEDFALSEDEGDEKRAKTVSGGDVRLTRDMQKLSRKDKEKLLDRQHSEMLPLMSHFGAIATELQTKTLVATRALFDGEEGTAEAVGATKLGQRYLVTKALLQTSATLHLAVYLLLKSEQGPDAEPALIQSHPVIARLKALNILSHRLETDVEGKVDGLLEQLDNLVKAAALLNETTGDADSGDGTEDVGSTESVEEEQNESAMATIVPMNDGTSSVDEHESDDDVRNVSAQGRNSTERSLINEARFGLRPSELALDRSANRSMGRTTRHKLPVEFGDDTSFEPATTGAAKSLASTLNSIEQRAAKSKKQSAPLPEDVDKHEEDNGELRRGLQMMEDALAGKIEDSDAEQSADDQGQHESMNEDDDGEVESDFYERVAKTSKSRKEVRKKRYEVAPKYPRAELEIEGERAISKTIMKNRGLVAHKSKLNRNPRVKKREQYRKAVIRRKGAVREIRTDESHKYGGEETGIKSNVSRSRKLG